MAFPTTSVLDAFTRADGGLGANYATMLFSSAPRISSNAVIPAVGGGFSGGVWTVANFGPNAEAYVDLVTLPTGWKVGVTVRWDNSTFLGYYAEVTASGTAIVYNGGTLASNATVFAAGDKFGIRVTGSLIEVFRYTAGAWNQTPVLSFTDTTVTGSGAIAFYVQDGGTGTCKTDNFGGGTVVTSTLFTKTLTASFTPTPVIVRQGKLVKSATVTNTVVIVKQARPVKAASQTFSAVISSRAVTKSLTATQTFTATVARQTRHTVTATQSFTATVASSLVTRVTLTATQTFTAAVSTMSIPLASARQFVTGRRIGAAQPDDTKNVGGKPRN